MIMTYDIADGTFETISENTQTDRQEKICAAEFQADMALQLQEFVTVDSQDTNHITADMACMDCDAFLRTMK